jgi:hypothetical protein
MARNTVLNISVLLMIALAIVMIVLGFKAGPKIMLPPIITGLGFLVIAWVFSALKEK